MNAAKSNYQETESPTFFNKKLPVYNNTKTAASLTRAETNKPQER